MLGNGNGHKKSKKRKLDLSGFTGTSEYHAGTFGLIQLTDGVHYVREEGQAHWLITDIESYQPEIARSTPFQSWKLKKTGEITAILECTDGDYKPCIDSRGKQIANKKYKLTDFWKNTGLDEVKFYLYNRTLMLTSEY